MKTIGQQLQHARTARGLSIDDVAFQTRIPAAKLRDMENDDLSRFANLTYARGFLKLYSAFLDLDLGDYLGQFRTDEFAHASGHEYVQTASATQNLPAAVITGQGRARRPGLYVLAAVAGSAGAVIWWNHDWNGAAEEPVPAHADVPPALAQPGVDGTGNALETPPVSPPPAMALDVTAAYSRPESRIDPAEPVPPAAPVKTGPPPRARAVEEDEP